jgi:hypothetical protein
VSSAGGKGHPGYLRLLKERIQLHIEKSGGYGTDDDPFANFTAVANAKDQPRYVYPVDRVQEKLARAYSLIRQGREDLLEEEFSGRKKDSAEAEAAEWLVVDDRSKVEAWRLKILLEAGYPLAIAERIAAGGADLHVACDMLGGGCAPELAATILL